MIIHPTLMAIFKWCVIRHGSKNGHQKTIFLKEFELHAQNLLIVLGSKLTLIRKRKMLIDDE